MWYQLQRIVHKFSAAAFVCVGLYAAAFGGGVLDPSFGTGGIANFRFGQTNFASTAALQPDGKIVVVGTTAPAGQSASFNDISVARLNADGTIDTTFGTDGFVRTDFENEQEFASAILILPDGKILIAGGRRAWLGMSYAFALVRYNPDGSLDATFGEGGKAVTDFPQSGSESVSFLMPLTDGKFIAGGSFYIDSPEFNSQRIVFVRYNSNGTVDTTYGTNGVRMISVEKTVLNIDGWAMLQDGSVLVAGTYVYQIPGCIPNGHNSCSAFQSFLRRYTADNRRDRRFGRRVGQENINQRALGIYPMSDGKFMLGGFPRVVRYHANGRLDRFFEYAAFPNQSPQVQNGPMGLTVRPDGSVVGCRQLNGGNGYDDMGLVLFTSQGQVIGYEQRNFFNADDYCGKILIQPDGKIILTGTAQLEQQGPYSIAVLRYLDIVQ
jgi:uncharacterized delta-60 repeat protein